MIHSAAADSHDPDRALVKRAQSGDDEAFGELVHRHTPTIYSLAVRVLGDPADAEDAVQEVFLNVFRNLRRFDDRGRFFSWLYTIALNQLRSILRRPAFVRRNELLPVSDHILASPAMGPEDQLISKETRELIDRALEALSPVRRRVFTLRQLQGLSTEETAEILTLPVNTVKTHLRRARAQVASILTSGETSERELRISERSETG